MRRTAILLLIFTAGWGVGWLTLKDRESGTAGPAPAALPGAARRADPGTGAGHRSPAPPADSLAGLLQRNDFVAALARYEALQDRAGHPAVAAARTRILSRARQLLAEGRFGLAERLLQRFLVTGYRDAEARLLLAEAYAGVGDLRLAIDQLYEARGHAWQPDMLARVTDRLRATVSARVRELKGRGDTAALLALYQHLVQLEPDYAPWFIGLAATQVALDDRAAARRSLRFVSQDPVVGARAQAMLAELDVAPAGLQDTARRQNDEAAAGIPLHRSGNHFLVDATPAHGRRLRLLIDTGATLTVFTRAALERQEIRYRDTGRTGLFLTANGPVRAPVYRLDSLAVGGWQVNHLDIGVLDLDGSPGVDGLLGMNFLSHFRFFIDQDQARLRLSAN